jgi:NADH dehydrogenase/NADH:ubiquinone oxidoreductase subunit G
MKEINVTVNGQQLTGKEGQTILELCRSNGIEIPTLCYLEGLPPSGSCRLCVVEVEGSRTLVGSCHTPLTPGMVIHTDSPKVIETRRMIVELILASHPDSCVICDKANQCELRKIAADLNIGLTRVRTRKRYFPVEDISPYLIRDMSKCILCRRCVRACSQIAKKNIMAIGYRGFDSKIVVDTDKPVDKEACKDCNVCVDVCPTGALSKPGKQGKEPLCKLQLIKG